MPIDHQTLTPDRIDQMSVYLQRKWYASDRIVVYKPYTGDESTIAEWSRVAADTIRNWKHPQIYLAIHDISQPGVAMKYTSRHKNILLPGVTDEGMQAIRDSTDNRQLFEARIALLVSGQFSGHITRTFAQIEAYNRIDEHGQFKIFIDENAALNWLSSFLT